MNSDKYRKEFIEFDKQIDKKILERARQLPKKMEDKSLDYKVGLMAGYILGADESKSIVFKWLKNLDIMDTSNYHNELEK